MTTILNLHDDRDGEPGTDRAPRATEALRASRRGIRLSRRTGFWVVAGSLAALTAFSTAPSPLYGLYRRQDHLSSTMVTVVYAVYAVGLVASLLLVGHVSDWYGRRPVLVPALVTALVAALLLSFSTSLPALLVGRVLTGLALGAAIATATAYLTDLDTGGGSSPSRRSQVVATVANVGGLAVGPLTAGVLAQLLPSTPRLPYAIFAALLVAAAITTVAAPEGRVVPRPRHPYRPQALAAPSGARAQFGAGLVGAFMVFTVFGVFAGLAGAFLAGPLRQSSTALAGLAVFLSFGVGAPTQVSTMSWSLRRLLALGIPTLLSGLAAVVGAAWVQPPSLALFLVGAVLVGIGGGAIYRGSLTLVLSSASGGNRAGPLASFFVVGYLGLSLPVVTAGIALNFASLKVTILDLGIGVTVGLLLASPFLLRLDPASSR